MPILASLGVGAIGAYVRFRNAVVPEKVYVEDVFSTYLYTGNSGTQTIMNGIDLSGKGGLVWIKQRTANATSASHQLTDTNRGVRATLFSNSTTASDTNATYRLTAFNSNGFSVNDMGAFGTNISGETYTSWTFRKQPKFFDVVTYTGTGVTNRQIPHNLQSTPGCVMIKKTSGSGDWIVWNRGLSSPSGSFGLLNGTNAFGQNSDALNFTNPTSTHITVGTADTVNTNGESYIAYIFAHDAGGFGLTGTDNVISCGSFTTDGSSNAPAVNLGYEPQWILVKSINNPQSWIIYDNMRSWSVTGSAYLLPNSSSEEVAQGAQLPINATGFGPSTGNLWLPSTNYMYIAIRRGPMKIPTDATTVFNALLSSGSGTDTSPIEFDSVWYIGRNAGTSRGVYDRLRKFNSATPLGSLLSFYDTTQENNSSNALVWFTGQNQKTLNYASALSVGFYLRRAPGFFDVVTYTGTDNNRTVSHNLGVVPELIITRKRGAGENWCVYAAPLGATNFLNLNTTAAQQTSSTRWNNTQPTSSVFSVGTSAETNGGNFSYMAYLFASLPGVSKIGTYNGTGNTLQIDCGFTSGARFVLIKRYEASGYDWWLHDSARGIIAGNDPQIRFNGSEAEFTTIDWIDPFSGGFELSSGGHVMNQSGGAYIFLAIA